jgi:hypothetical protein
MLGKNLTNEEKLDAIYAMTFENHQILKTIRRQQYVSGVMRILYWILVLGALGGAYYYVRPLVNVFINNSTQLQSSFMQLKGQFPEANLVNKIMEAVKKPTYQGTSTSE